MPVVVPEHERVGELVSGAGNGFERFRTACGIPVGHEYGGIIGVVEQIAGDVLQIGDGSVEILQQ